MFLEGKRAPQQSPQIPGVSFPLSLQVKCILGSMCFCQGKRATRGIASDSSGQCDCKFSFVSKPGRRPYVDKGPRLRYVTFSSSQNACRSAPNAWDVKGGIPQNAC